MTSISHPVYDIHDVNNTRMADVVGYWQLRLTSRCRHPDPGQDLIPLQRLHVFAHSRDPHPAIKLWCQVPFTKSKTTFQIEMYLCSAFWKANISKVELSMIKIGELLRKLWSLRSCFNILPPGTHTPQGIEGAMKRDVSKHRCTLQWCVSRGWFIAHENWTSWMAIVIGNDLYIFNMDPSELLSHCHIFIPPSDKSTVVVASPRALINPGSSNSS